MSEENKRFMRRFVKEVINQKNLAALDELVADEFLEHLPFPGQGPGRAGLKDAISAFVSAFPDLHWTIDEQIAEGEKVVSRFTMTGTHRGEFLAFRRRTGDQGLGSCHRRGARWPVRGKQDHHGFVKFDAAAWSIRAGRRLKFKSAPFRVRQSIHAQETYCSCERRT